MSKRLATFFFLFLIGMTISCANQPAEEPTPPTATAVPDPTNTPTPQTADADTLYVNAAITNGEISPLVYGTNFGPWITVPLNVLEDYKASGLTYLRFPGGNWGDTNTTRPYQVDQLMDWAEMIDAEVGISVNLLQGSPEEAAELVQYTQDKGYDIAHWSIGNEPNLFPESRGATEYDDIDFYNQRWRDYAEAMKAVDPNIILIGPDINQYYVDETKNPKDAQGRDWMREFLRANGDMVDIVSFHRYPFPTTPAQPVPKFEELRDNPPEWDELIPKIKEVILAETGREIPVGVMEINSNWSIAAQADTTPDSHYNAIWLADVLGRMIEQDVEIVGQFALQHNSNGWGLLARSEPRPSYFVYRLYQHYGRDRIHADSGVPYVSIYAAEREDGALTLMLINRSDTAVATPLHIDNFTPNNTTLWLFDQEHNAEEMGAIEWENGQEITLPAQSISLLVLEP